MILASSRNLLTNTTQRNRMRNDANIRSGDL